MITVKQHCTRTRCNGLQKFSLFLSEAKVAQENLRRHINMSIKPCVHTNSCAYPELHFSISWQHMCWVVQCLLGLERNRFDWEGQVGCRCSVSVTLAAATGALPRTQQRVFFRRVLILQRGPRQDVVQRHIPV